MKSIRRRADKRQYPGLWHFAVGVVRWLIFRPRSNGMGGISTKEQTINVCHYLIVMGKATFKIQKPKQDDARWTSIKQRTMSWGIGASMTVRAIRKSERLESIGHLEGKGRCRSN